MVTFVLGAAFLFIADTLQGRMPAEDILVLAVVAVVGHVYMMLMLPILFKFTVDRARIILVIIFLIPFGVIMLVSKTVPAQNQPVCRAVCRSVACAGGCFGRYYSDNYFIYFVIGDL